MSCFSLYWLHFLDILRYGGAHVYIWNSGNALFACLNDLHCKLILGGGGLENLCHYVVLLPPQSSTTHSHSSSMG